MPVGNPWFNTSVQQLQPCFIQPHVKSASVEQNKNVSRIQITRASLTSEQNPCIVDGESQPEMGVCTDDSFTGGSCLRLTADIGNSQFAKYRTKTFPDSDKPVPTFGKEMACMYVHAIPPTSLPKLLSVSAPQQNNTSWRTRWFPVHSLYMKFCRLTSVRVGLTTTDPQPKKCIALLGNFKVASRKDSAVVITESCSGMLKTEQEKPTLELGEDTKMVEKQLKAPTMDNDKTQLGKLQGDQDLRRDNAKGHQSEKKSRETEQYSAAEENPVHDVSKVEECDSENCGSSAGAVPNSDIENLTEKLHISD